jgi:hypothetical protein
MSFDDAYMLEGTPWRAEDNYNREAHSLPKSSHTRVSVASASASANLLTNGFAYCRFLNPSAMFAATLREDLRVWLVSAYRSSMRKVFDTSKIFIARSKAELIQLQIPVSPQHSCECPPVSVMAPPGLVLRAPHFVCLRPQIMFASGQG